MNTNRFTSHSSKEFTICLNHEIYGSFSMMMNDLGLKIMEKLK